MRRISFLTLMAALVLTMSAARAAEKKNELGISAATPTATPTAVLIEEASANLAATLKEEGAANQATSSAIVLVLNLETKPAVSILTSGKPIVDRKEEAGLKSEIEEARETAATSPDLRRTLVTNDGHPIKATVMLISADNTTTAVPKQALPNTARLERILTMLGQALNEAPEATTTETLPNVRLVLLMQPANAGQETHGAETQNGATTKAEHGVTVAQAETLRTWKLASAEAPARALATVASE